MKKLLIAVVLLLSVFTFANAQNPPQGGPGGNRMSSEERAQKQTETLSTRLSLTAEQKTQVQGIFLAQAKSVDSLRKAAEGDMQAMRGKMQPIQQANDNKIQSLLTEEQKKQYTAYQEERRSRMQSDGQRQKDKKPTSER